MSKSSRFHSGSQSLWGLLLSAGIVAGWPCLAPAQDCAPPYGAQKSCAAPPRRAGSCRPRTRTADYDAEFERRLAEEVAAAVAEAMLQAERERLGSGAGAGTGAGAPTEFVAPPPSGVVAGASNSFGIRGMEVTFPEWKLAMPSIQLPCLVHLRREAEMLLDPGRATMTRGGTAAPTGAGAGLPGGLPNGVFIPFPQQQAPGGAGAPATTPSSAGATASHDEQPVPRRVRHSRSRWREDEYEFEEEFEPSCAPPPSCAPTARRSVAPSVSPHEPVPAPSAGSASPDNDPGLPPMPVSAKMQQELEQARLELQQTRDQLRQLTALVSEVQSREVKSREIPSSRAAELGSDQQESTNFEHVGPDDLFDLPAQPRSGVSSEASEVVQRSSHTEPVREPPSRSIVSPDDTGRLDSKSANPAPRGLRRTLSKFPLGFNKTRQPDTANGSLPESRGPGHSVFRK